MDHRIGERNKAALPVSLTQDGRLLGWFTTRDVSPGGICLRGDVANLSNSSIVNVALESTSADAAGKQEFKAFVVHQEEGCIGLMWIENLAGRNVFLASQASIAA